jgi:hypothetical protein
MLIVEGTQTGSIRYNVSGFGTGTYSYTVNGGTPQRRKL